MEFTRSAYPLDGTKPEYEEVIAPSLRLSDGTHFDFYEEPGRPGELRVMVSGQLHVLPHGGVNVVFLKTEG